MLGEEWHSMRLLRSLFWLPRGGKALNKVSNFILYYLSPRPPHNPCPQSILGLGQGFFALSRECTGGAKTGDRDITCPIPAQCLGAFTNHKNSGKLQKSPSCIILFPFSYTQKLKGRGVFRADWIESNDMNHDVVALEKRGHSLAYNSVFYQWVFSYCHDAITCLKEDTTLRWVYA